MNGFFHQLIFTEKECKERWRNIRSSYLRYLKNVPPRGSGVHPKTTYYLAEYLQCLQPFTKPGTQKGNVQLPENTEADNVSDSCSLPDRLNRPRIENNEDTLQVSAHV
jgi:hypothetical protein